MGEDKQALSLIEKSIFSPCDPSIIKTNAA